MERLGPILAAMAGMGIIGVAAAVVVPLAVIGIRDRGEGELALRPTSTPVLQGVGGVTTTSPTPTPVPATPTPVQTLPAATSTPTPSGAPVGDPVAGQQVFQTPLPIACNVCHSLDGTVGLGPSLQGISTEAVTRVSGLSAEEYIRQSILDPTAFVVEGFGPVMPLDFGDTLTDRQLDDVVAFLLTQ